MGKVGKKFLSAKKAFEGKEDVSLDEAVNLIKNNASAKFDETIDIAINLGVDPKHADQMVRGVCALPHVYVSACARALVCAVLCAIRVSPRR